MLSSVRRDTARTEEGTHPLVQVFTLGGFRVLVGGRAVEDSAWRRKTARQLFKVLLSRSARRMTRDEVVELFWPDSGPEAASSNLRSTMYAMRRALESQGPATGMRVVFGDHDSVWLRPDMALWTDADAFEQLVAQAWRAAEPVPVLERASRYYVGDYLPDDLYEGWAAERREALKRTWTELQFGLARAAEHRSDVSDAVERLENLLRDDPCDERAAQELMKLLARHGRRAEALRVYQRLRQSLREELDVEPSPESGEVHRQISAGQASVSPRRWTSFRCSYPFPPPTELIAREHELTVLSELVASGRAAGKLALVAAPAGTGKSALLGQIVRQAQAEGMLCLAGGCYEGRGALPLGPFQDGLVDFLLAQPADRIRADLGATLDDLAQLIPELRHHLHMAPGAAPAPSPVDRMRAFGAIHACLRSLAEHGPVLVCLEDLHAADEASLHLLHYLARQTRRLPLVLIATYRSDEVAAESALAQTVAAMARERLAQRITLSALRREETDRLVSSLLQAPPAETLSESLYATTGGNPLFIEQLVLALSESGQLEHKAGVWHGLAELQGAPQIVREVVAHRLQRLDPSCREVLAMASVLGQSFDHRVLLAATDPPDEASLLRDLDHAIGAQLLQEVPGGYAFRHAVLRDAVYWDLSTPRRMLLHARAGELLERLHGQRADEYAADLALHFRLAGESPRVRARALHYCLEAGRQANALSSNREALTQFVQALDILEQAAGEVDPIARLEALEGRGFAERGMGLLSQAVESFRSILKLTDEPGRRARVRGEIASALLHNDPAQALAEVASGLAELEGLADRSMAGRIRLRIQSFEAMYWFLGGRYAKVLALGETMLAAARPLAEPRALARAEAVVSWSHIGAGRVAQALLHSQRALADAQHSGDKSEIGAAHIDLGLEHYLGGRFATAREHLERARALYAESANDVWMANALQLLGRVALADGDLITASARAEAALTLAVGQQERWAAECYDLLGRVHTLAAEPDSARANFSQAAAIRRRIGHTAGLVDSLVGLGKVYEQAGDWDQAGTLYAEAVETARPLDACPSLVAAWRHRGRLYRLMRNLPEATAALDRACATAASCSETLEYAPTLLALAELQADTHDVSGALANIEQALERPRTTECAIEAHATAADLLLGIGRLEAAAHHAAASLRLAKRFGAPRLLALALSYAGAAGGRRYQRGPAQPIRR